MALTFGAYAAPDLRRLLALAAVAGITAVNDLGVRKTAWLTRGIVVVVVASLAAVVVAALGGGAAFIERLGPVAAGGVAGILEAAGLLFFAFAGYARIATLGEEVIDAARTVPRAVPLALGVTPAVGPLVLVADLRGAIRFSSFAVSSCCAIANAAAWTLPAEHRRWPRLLAGAGAGGCAVLALALPLASVVTGIAVLGLGAGIWAIRSGPARRTQSPAV